MTFSIFLAQFLTCFLNSLLSLTAIYKAFFFSRIKALAFKTILSFKFILKYSLKVFANLLFLDRLFINLSMLIFFGIIQIKFGE